MAFVIPMAIEAAASIGSAAATVGSAAGSAIGGIGAAAGGIGASTAGIGSLLTAGTAAEAAGSAVAGSSLLADASLGAQALGSVTGALGALQQGRAASQSAKYNAAVARGNAQVAGENAALSGQAGAEQAGIQSQRTRAAVGSIKANQAASGLDVNSGNVNSGSAVGVRSSAQELGELDALTVRSNAAKEAYSYQVQGRNFGAQSTLDQYEAENASTAGEIGAASSFLSGAGNAGLNFAKYQLAGGFSG